MHEVSGILGRSGYMRSQGSRAYAWEGKDDDREAEEEEGEDVMGGCSV